MPQVLSFLVSAIWHGIEPGLFVTFFGFGMVLYMWKVAEKTKLVDAIARTVPFFVYHPVRWLFIYFIACYYVICFELRHFSVFLELHAKFYHVGTWLIPLLCLAVTFMPKVKRQRPQSSTSTLEKQADDSGVSSTNASPTINEKKKTK